MSTGDCAICSHVTQCDTRCGGGGWADSCERDDGTIDTELREHIGSREWRLGVGERVKQRDGKRKA